MFSILYKLINPAIHRMVNAQIFCVLDKKNKKGLNPNFCFTACFPKFL